jgi:hypothetical protein
MNMTGQRICLWTAPVVGILWIVCFFTFPGFTTPLSPTMSAEAVAAFYADPGVIDRTRYGMILFNWSAFGFLLFYGLITVQMKRMGHNSEVLAYGFLATATSAACLIAVTVLCFQIAAFRPERDPAIMLLLNDLAWMTFTVPVSFLMAQCGVLALGIYLDRQPNPVYSLWIAHFNIIVMLLLAPCVFASIRMTGPLAWDGAWSYWLRISLFVLWIVVMYFAAAKEVKRSEINARLAPAVQV